jgi:hypothetical protein
MTTTTAAKHPSKLGKVVIDVIDEGIVLRGTNIVRLAEPAGIPTSTLRSRMEDGNFNVIHMVRIALALDFDPVQMFKDIEDRMKEVA